LRHQVVTYEIGDRGTRRRSTPPLDHFKKWPCKLGLYELKKNYGLKIDLLDNSGVPVTFANHPEWETKDQFDVCMNR
jgi:hypothetical protein